MPTAHSPQPTAHSPQPTAHSPQPTAHSPQPTAHSPQPTAHSPQPTATAHSPQPTAHSPQPTAHSPQPTAHSPQPTAHSPQPTAHSPQPTAHSPQPTAHSPQPTAHSPQPTAHSPQPTAHSPQPTAHSPQPTAHSPRRPLAATLSHLRRGRRALVFVLALGAWAATAAAQPGFESPAPKFPGLTPLSEVPVLETPAIDAAAARVASAGAGDRSLQFAEPFTVDVSPLSHGRWETTPDGRTAVWRLRVVSAGAVSLNFGFTRYWMPPGGRLRVHTPDGAEVLGPYTDADNEEHGQLWTPILSGGDAVIEVTVPADRIGELDLGLAKVNRGFRDLAPVASGADFRPLTDPPPPAHFLPCHIDVVCSPQGDLYRDQIRSVGEITIDGAFTCTGTLVNNTAEDGKPYFLTARHCFESAHNLSQLRALAASMVVYWNFERPACKSGTGPKTDTQTGAVLRVARDEPVAFKSSGLEGATDTVLLELDDELDPAHHLYLAGWDVGSSAPALPVVAIHHPADQEKSLSFVDKEGGEALTRTAYYANTLVAGGDFWRVGDWTRGSIESGSSGSALFNPDKRTIGVLRGGEGRCGEDDPVWYGALAVSWKHSDGSSLRQLADWLDPGDTGVTTLDGMDANTKPRSLRALDDKAVKVPGTGETAEALVVDLAPFFFDPDGHTLTYTATSDNESAVTVSVSGSSVSLTPVALGSATITVTATDGSPNGSVQSEFQVTAGDDNRSPEAVGTLAALTLDVGGTVYVFLEDAFTDGDGDALTLAVSWTPTTLVRGAFRFAFISGRRGDGLAVTAVGGSGTARIYVTATDAGGSNTKAQYHFDVTVLGDGGGGGGDGGGGDGDGGGDGGGGGGDGGGDGGGGGGGGSRPRDDHGNTAGRATRIAPSERTAGQLNTRSDVDYFTLTAPQAGVLVVETTGTTATRGTVWQDGTEVATADSGGSGPNFRLSVRVEAGPVVMAVRGNGRQTGHYTLQTTLVVASLENPAPTSFQSGLGLISGWVCAGEAVTVEIERANGTVVELAAAYGTARADTADVCGDTNNGFGLLVNWNLLGDGTHAVVALVDGIEVGRASVTVTTLGAEFVEGLTGSFVVADFPRAGEQVRVVWQESQQNFVLAPVEGAGAAASAPTPSSGGIEGVLENPRPASYQSGIGVISGWVCEAEEVVIEIDGQPIAAAAGTERADTLDRCGDTDNGFGLLVNWAEFGAGEHEVVALVDGVELSRATVMVTMVDATEPFVRGLAKRVEVASFPTPGETVTLEWQQSQQNFVITGVEM